MSNQEPDGWVAWHPVKGWFANGLILSRTEAEAERHVIADMSCLHITSDLADCQKKFDDDGWQIKPVMLISPQELSRLRLIDEWAKQMWDRLNTISLGFQSPIDSAHADMLCQQYDAITEAKP